jgi:small subunit ribosomal protein S6
MRHYEVTVVIPSDVSDEDVPKVLSTVQGWIEAEGGKVTEFINWGRRRLAYQIKEYTEANYVLIKSEMSAAMLPEVDRNLKLSQQIIRHLIVRAE